jgi:predicted ATPase
MVNRYDEGSNGVGGLTFSNLSRFKLTNFKSFRETTPIEFTAGLNVIVGQNNAGKSSLLEALTLQPGWNPHKSPLTMTFDGAPPIQQSSIDVSLSVSRGELLEIMKGMPGTQFYLAYAAPRSEFALSINFIDDSTGSFKRLGDWFLSQSDFTFQ